MKVSLIILSLLLPGTLCNAQSELDIYNIYDVKIFEIDSIAKKHNVKSTSVYLEALNGVKELLSNKQYRDGYIASYKRKFLKYPFLIIGVVLGNGNEREVLYRFKNTRYKEDSLLFLSLFGNFISESAYNYFSSDLILRIKYYRNDTTIIVRNYIDTISIGLEYSISNPNSSVLKMLNTPRRFKKSNNIKDTIITIDTIYSDNYKSVYFYYNSIYEQPVFEEHITYMNDSIVGKLSKTRKYDNKGRIVFHAVFTTMGDLSKYVLNKSEKTEYRTDGSYTVFEDDFLADGKPDIITSYDSKGRMIDNRHYFSEGGVSQTKYSYNKQGLLSSSTFYVNGKFNGKSFRVYSFYK